MAAARGLRRKRIVRGAVALLLLAAVFWATINVLLNLPWAKRKIESKTNQLVGMPLEVGKILVMPWGTIRLIDLRMMPVPEASYDRKDFPPLVSCGEIRIEMNPLSLLTRRIGVESIEVVEPVLSVMRSSSGGLMLPAGAVQEDLKAEDRPGKLEPEGSEASIPGTSPLFVMPNGGAGGEVSGESLLAEASAQEEILETEGMMNLDQGKKADQEDPAAAKTKPKSVASIDAKPEAPGGVPAKDESSEGHGDQIEPTKEAGSPIVIRYVGRDFYLGEIVLQRGLMRVTSMEDGKTLMAVEDLEMELNLGEDILQPGKFSAKRIALFDVFEATELRGEVVQNGLWIDFLNVIAETGGGQVEGKVRASPFFSGVPFLAAIRMKDVGIGEVTSKLPSAAVVEGGSLEGEVKVLGRLRDPSSYEGRGQAKVEGARLGKSPILGPLSKVANTAALADVALNDVFVKFAVVGRTITINDLRASSQDIALAGRGAVSTQGYLNLALRLYVSEQAYFGVQAIEKLLPEGLGLGFFQDQGNAERFYRDYLITGTAKAPMINFWRLDEKMPVADLKEQLVDLIGKGTKDQVIGGEK